MMVNLKLTRKGKKDVSDAEELSPTRAQNILTNKEGKTNETMKEG
jgi:hypothetical protein